jgi:hypothetical protein
MERARSSNFCDLFRRAADYADKSLRGAKLGNPLAEQQALGLRWRHVKGSHGFDEQISGANEQIPGRGQSD